MIRLIIVGDDVLFRAGLQRILEDAHDIRVPADCDYADAVETTTAHDPDVVLLSDERRRKDTLSLLTALRAQSAPPEVAVLTSAADERFVVDSLLAGATGFLLRDTVPHDLVNAVRLLASGSSALAPSASRTVVGHLQARPQKEAPSHAAALSDRELDVLSLLAEGLTNAEIGRALLLSPATVKDHLSAIYTKLGTTNRVQTAVLAHRMGADRDSRARTSGDSRKRTSRDSRTRTSRSVPAQSRSMGAELRIPA